MTNPEVLQELLGDGATDVTNPLAGLDSMLTDTLPTILVVSIVVMSIIGILAIILTISRIRSQVATVAMQKDVKAIRELLERRSQPPKPDNTQVPQDTARENTASL